MIKCTFIADNDIYDINFSTRICEAVEDIIEQGEDIEFYFSTPVSETKQQYASV